MKSCKIISKHPLVECKETHIRKSMPKNIILDEHGNIFDLYGNQVGKGELSQDEKKITIIIE